MKVRIKTNFSFSKLLEYVKSESFSKEQNKRIGSHVAESSKRFIMQGRVKPALLKSTIKRRMNDGVSTYSNNLKEHLTANTTLKDLQIEAATVLSLETLYILKRKKQARL